MNYQYPLLNLVTRGHLKVKNPVAMQKFIEGLDNDSCATILENLLFNTDSMDCTHKLNNLLESYELQNNIRQSVSESTLAVCRDKVLLKEDLNDYDNPLENFAETKSGVKDIVKLIKMGFITVAASKFLGMDKKKKKEILDQLKRYSEDAYAKLISNPIVASTLPKDVGFFPRTLDAMWTFGKSNSLKPSDREYLSKIGNLAKGTSMIAAGVIGAIIAGNILYKQVFSNEARQCNKFSGKQRTICMCKAIIVAAESAQKRAEENLLHCDEASDPRDCRFKMKIEIRSWMRKAEEQKKKLLHLERVNKTAYPVQRPPKEKITPVDVGTPSNPFGNEFSSAPVIETPVVATTQKTNNPFE